MAKRTDTNQARIVAALRKAGATVVPLHTIGKGCPDLLVGYRTKNYLLEVKTDTGKKTPDQQEFFDTWRGSCQIVHTVDEALEAIGAI
jgi:Holliday junction resolvase